MATSSTKITASQLKDDTKNTVNEIKDRVRNATDNLISQVFAGIKWDQEISVSVIEKISSPPDFSATRNGSVTFVCGKSYSVYFAYQRFGAPKGTLHTTVIRFVEYSQGNVAHSITYNTENELVSGSGKTAVLSGDGWCETASGKPLYYKEMPLIIHC
jgi:hypothetical protein